MLTPGLCYKDIRPGTPEGGVYIGRFVEGENRVQEQQLKYYFVNSYGKKITIQMTYDNIYPRPENPDSIFDPYFQATPCLEVKKTGIPVGELVENKCYNLETPGIIPTANMGKNYVGKFRHQSSRGDHGPYIDFESILFTKNEYPPHHLPSKKHYVVGDRFKNLRFTERPCRTLGHSVSKLGEKIGRVLGRPAAPAAVAPNYGSSEEHPEANDYWAQQDLESAWHTSLNSRLNNARRNYLSGRVNRTTRRRANAINRHMPAFLEERRARTTAARERNAAALEARSAREIAPARAPRSLNDVQNPSKKIPENVLEHYKGPECSICQSAFIDPTTLPCEHSFCRNEIIAVKTGTPANANPRCPMCRREIPADFEFPVNKELDAEVRAKVAEAELEAEVSPRKNFMKTLKARNNQATSTAAALKAKYSKSKRRGGKRTQKKRR